SDMPKTLALLAACTAILAAQTPQTDYSRFQQGITNDQQTLHALNRLTFGPRRGDVEAVKEMGLKQWIDLQLHPERISESEALMKLVEPLVEPTGPQAISPQAFQGGAVFVSIQNGVPVITRGASDQELRQMVTQDQLKTLRTGSDKEALEVLATLPQETVV